jgi:hypothetical protein
MKALLKFASDNISDEYNETDVDDDIIGSTKTHAIPGAVIGTGVGAGGALAASEYDKVMKAKKLVKHLRRNKSQIAGDKIKSKTINKIHISDKEDDLKNAFKLKKQIAKSKKSTMAGTNENIRLFRRAVKGGLSKKKIALSSATLGVGGLLIGNKQHKDELQYT